ncbi:hypothetical protein Aduo_016960 [Ancylostoma duodenale]
MTRKVRNAEPSPQSTGGVRKIKPPPTRTTRPPPRHKARSLPPFAPIPNTTRKVESASQLSTIKKIREEEAPYAQQQATRVDAEHVDPIIVVCFVVLGFALIQLFLIGACLAIRLSSAITRLYEPAILVDAPIARTAPRSVPTTPLPLTPRIAMQVEREEFSRMARAEKVQKKAKSEKDMIHLVTVKTKPTLVKSTSAQPKMKNATRRSSSAPVKGTLKIVGKFTPRTKLASLKGGSGSKEKTKTASKESANPRWKEGIVVSTEGKSKKTPNPRSKEGVVASAGSKSKENPNPRLKEGTVASARSKSKENANSRSKEGVVASVGNKSKENVHARSKEGIMASSGSKSEEKSAEKTA